MEFLTGLLPGFFRERKSWSISRHIRPSTLVPIVLGLVMAYVALSANSAEYDCGGAEKRVANECVLSGSLSVSLCDFYSRLPLDKSGGRIGGETSVDARKEGFKPGFEAGNAPKGSQGLGAIGKQCRSNAKLTGKADYLQHEGSKMNCVYRSILYLLLGVFLVKVIENSNMSRIFGGMTITSEKDDSFNHLMESVDTKLETSAVTWYAIGYHFRKIVLILSVGAGVLDMTLNLDDKYSYVSLPWDMAKYFDHDVYVYQPDVEMDALKWKFWMWTREIDAPTPLRRLFPLYANCDFSFFGPGGGYTGRNYRCFLGPNVHLYDSIPFVYLAQFLALASLTLSLLWDLLPIVFCSLKASRLESCVNSGQAKNARGVGWGHSYTQFVFLHLISYHLPAKVFSAIIKERADELTGIRGMEEGKLPAVTLAEKSEEDKGGDEQGGEEVDDCAVVGEQV